MVTKHLLFEILILTTILISTYRSWLQAHCHAKPSISIALAILGNTVSASFYRSRKWGLAGCWHTHRHRLVTESKAESDLEPYSHHLKAQALCQQAVVGEKIWLLQEYMLSNLTVLGTQSVHSEIISIETVSLKPVVCNILRYQSSVGDSLPAEAPRTPATGSRRGLWLLRKGLIS